ncbi:hypothetical protein TNCV_3810911 [Trichonephila clavipes]|nr:hypothetical protein TNCV_3810911 [Trichonephila clavipes]
MSACGRELDMFCLPTQSSSFEAEGLGSQMRRRPAKPHACSIGYISGGKSRPKKKLHGDALKEGRLRALALHERTCYYPDCTQFVAAAIVPDTKSYPRP